MRMLQRMIWVGFGIRFLVAIWNGFFGPSFGADLDAQSFHLLAVEYARNLQLAEFKVGWFYSYILGALYSITGSSLFVGSLLSCVAWLVSARIFCRNIRLLALGRKQARYAMMIYALLPSSVLFTGVTLREVYQLLFVNLAVFSALMLQRRRGNSTVYWFLLALAVVGMGVLHGGLFAFGVFVIAATFAIRALRRRKKIALSRLFLILPVIVLVISGALTVFGKVSYDLKDGLGAAIMSYQEGGLNTVARTNYKDSVDISGPLDLALFLPISLFQYLFEPMPWRVSALSDIPLVLENVLRGWLVWRAITACRYLRGGLRFDVIFLSISFLVLELLWSVGTINWGTAARHHIPSVGILLLAAFAFRRPVLAPAPVLAPDPVLETPVEGAC